jgi:hypothetical protein
MPALYERDDVEVTCALLDTIAEEVADAKGMHYLPQVFKEDGNLQWQALILGGDVKVYASVVDRDGVVLYPKQGVTAKGKAFIPEASIVLPAMYLSRGNVDPAEAYYKFNDQSEVNFTSKMSFVDEADEAYVAKLFAEQSITMSKWDEFMTDGLLDFLCNGRTPDGQMFQDRLFETFWNGSMVGRDLEKLGVYLSSVYNDPNNDLWLRPTRTTKALLKKKLIDMDWERRKSGKKFDELREADKEYVHTWRELSKGMDAETRDGIRTKLAMMEKQIIDSFSTANPKMVSRLKVTDSEDSLMTQADIVQHIAFGGALATATIAMPTFRTGKKFVTDIEPVSVQIHINGTANAVTASTGITSKAFGGVKPRQTETKAVAADDSSDDEAPPKPAVTYMDALMPRASRPLLPTPPPETPVPPDEPAPPKREAPDSDDEEPPKATPKRKPRKVARVEE